MMRWAGKTSKLQQVVGAGGKTLHVPLVVDMTKEDLGRLLVDSLEDVACVPEPANHTGA